MAVEPMLLFWPLGENKFRSIVIFIMCHFYGYFNKQTAPLNYSAFEYGKEISHPVRAR